MKIRLTFVVPFLIMLCVFLWQFMLGLIIGREAGFLLYAIAGLLPSIVLGFPWFHQLMPSGDLDLTFQAIGTSLALRFHAAAFISLMLNALIISLIFEGLRRLRESLGRRGSGRKGIE